MGRPIKPDYIGKPSDYSDGRKVIVMNNAWITGASAVSTKPVYIVKQTGATRYIVSDGDTTGTVYLSDTVTEEGQANIRVVYGTNADYFFHVSKLLLNRVNTFQDKSLAWSFDGENAITSMTADEYNAAVTSASSPGAATIEVSNIAAQSFDITITAPTSGENTGIEYQIYTGTSESNMSILKTVDAAGLQTISGLTASTSYYVRVDTINSGKYVTSGTSQKVTTVPGAGE